MRRTRNEKEENLILFDVDWFFSHLAYCREDVDCLLDDEYNWIFFLVIHFLKQKIRRVSKNIPRNNKIKKSIKFRDIFPSNIFSKLIFFF